MDILADLLPVWYDDAIIPESVDALLEFIAEIDDETASAAITCWAYVAETTLRRN